LGDDLTLAFLLSRLADDMMSNQLDGF